MRNWIKLILGLIAIAAMVLLVIGIGRLTLNVLYHGSSAGERDPMFAETPEPTATIPPELTGETDGRTYEDRSAEWDNSVQTPVDRTADELAGEAEAASGNP